MKLVVKLFRNPFCHQEESENSHPAPWFSCSCWWAPASRGVVAVPGEAHVSTIIGGSWAQPSCRCSPCQRTGPQLRWLNRTGAGPQSAGRAETKSNTLSCVSIWTSWRERLCSFQCLKKTPGAGSPQKLSPLLQGGPARHYTGTTLWTFATTAKALVPLRPILSSGVKHFKNTYLSYGIK